MDTPIRMPFMERKGNNLQIQKEVQPGTSTAFSAHSFVKLNGSGILVPCVTQETDVYGWVEDASHGSTDKPPTALYGQNHWPFDCHGAQFVMNITDASGHIGQANAAPQLSSVLMGEKYALRVVTVNSVPTQLLDISDTTHDFAKVVGIYPNQSLTDYNGLVIVELVDAVLTQ